MANGTSVFSIPYIVVGAVLTAMTGVLTWFGTTLIEVDKTQESVLAQIGAQTSRCAYTQRQMQRIDDRQDVIWHELLEIAKDHNHPLPKFRNGNDQ